MQLLIICLVALSVMTISVGPIEILAASNPGDEAADMAAIAMRGQVPTEMVLGFAGVPVIVALTEFTKVVLAELSPRWYPVVALGWGLLMNAGLGGYLGADPVLGAVSGTLAGLAAVGLYSGGKAITR